MLQQQINYKLFIQMYYMEESTIHYMLVHEEKGKLSLNSFECVLSLHSDGNSGVTCSTLQCCTLPCSTLQCCTLPCSTLQFCTLPSSTLHLAVLYIAMQYFEVLYSAIQYLALCSAVLCHAVPCSDVLCQQCTVQQRHVVPYNAV